VLLLLRIILVLSNKDTFKMGSGLPFKTQWRLHFFYFYSNPHSNPNRPSREGLLVAPRGGATFRHPQIGDSAGEI